MRLYCNTLALRIFGPIMTKWSVAQTRSDALSRVEWQLAFVLEYFTAQSLPSPTGQWPVKAPLGTLGPLAQLISHCSHCSHSSHWQPRLQSSHFLAHTSVVFVSGIRYNNSALNPLHVSSNSQTRCRGRTVPPRALQAWPADSPRALLLLLLRSDRRKVHKMNLRRTGFKMRRNSGC